MKMKKYALCGLLWKQNRWKLRHSICGPLCGLLWVSVVWANSESKSCPWTDRLDKEREPVTTRQLKPARDGEPAVFQTCAEAIAEAQAREDQKAVNARAGQALDGDPNRHCGGPPPPCYFDPGKILPGRGLEAREIERKPDGTKDKDGNICYEPCNSAQWRAEQDWINTDFGGNRADLQAEIDKYNTGEELQAKSATEKAEQQAAVQALGSTLAIGGAVAAAVKAYSCCSAPPGTCPQCPFWVATTGALGAAGVKLLKDSKANTGVAAQLSAGLNSPPKGPPGPPPPPGITDGPPNTTGGDIPEPPSETEPPPEVEGPDGTKVPLNEDGLRTALNTLGKWDPEKAKITLPNGQSWQASDLDKPEFQSHMSSPEVASFKNQMAGMEKQMKEAMGIKDDTAGSDEDESPDGLLSGGGGFAGYGKGGGSFGGGGGGMAGRNPTGLSKASSDKDKNRVAGMSVKMGKDRVGVSQDNIFAMIHRRYKQNRKKGRFIE